MPLRDLSARQLWLLYKRALLATPPQFRRLLARYTYLGQLLTASLVRRLSSVLPPRVRRRLYSLFSPAAAAFLAAYVYTAIPAMVALVLRSFTRHRIHTLVPLVIRTARHALRRHGLPRLAAQLLLAMVVTQPLSVWATRRSSLRGHTAFAAATFLLALAAALATFPSFARAGARNTTLDLTLLVATRAADALLTAALRRGRWTRVAAASDSAFFMTASYLVMYAWFYFPDRLSPAYRAWISAASETDPELLDALRMVKDKQLVYGAKGPETHVLDAFCERHGQPPLQAYLAFQSQRPLSCECVHAFATQSCELHAAKRFLRGFRFAFKIYGAINVLVFLTAFRRRRGRGLVSSALRAALTTFRSSAFLGSFIALCWYGVCLGRTRLLPRVCPNVPPTRWDDTVCVAFGCALSGLSCFVETALRRRELALFVAPRAVGTLVLTKEGGEPLIETVVFALSMAVLATFVRQDASAVRGLFGRGLEMLFRAQAPRRRASLKA